LCGKKEKGGGPNLHKGAPAWNSCQRFDAVLPKIARSEPRFRQDGQRTINRCEKILPLRDNLFTKILENPLGKRDSAGYDAAGFVGTLNAAATALRAAGSRLFAYISIFAGEDSRRFCLYG
jgi:hypothetical protein